MKKRAAPVVVAFLSQSRRRRHGITCVETVRFFRRRNRKAKFRNAYGAPYIIDYMKSNGVSKGVFRVP